MKRGAPSHPKTYNLAEHLGIRRVHAVGLLELLFHFTAQYAPEGDIGRYPDRRIAAALDWASSVPRLIDGLVATGWVDRHSGVRLVVHDWHEHADRHVLQRLSRGGKKVIEQNQPDSSNLCTQSETENNSDRSEEVGLPVPVPVQRVAANFDLWAESVCQRHPKPKNRVLSLQALVRLAADPDFDQEQFDRNHIAWCGTEAWLDKNGNFAPVLAEWIDDRGYLKAPEPTSGRKVTDDSWVHELGGKEPE